MQAIKKPSETAPYTDSGLVNITAPGYSLTSPDGWIEFKNQGQLYYRTPNNGSFYINGDGGGTGAYRPLNRHAKRCNAAFADGHAESIAVSKLGLQFYPGTDSSGATATGVSAMGGNGRSDPRWMWDVE
jgi:prepilin-type processing-associated H-X9-DG protein